MFKQYKTRYKKESRLAKPCDWVMNVPLCHEFSSHVAQQYLIYHGTTEQHVNYTFAEHRSLYNCAVGKIGLHLHYRPIASDVIVSMSSLCLNLWIEQMLNEHQGYDVLRNNQCK